MRRGWSLGIFTVVLASGLVLAACGGDDDDSASATPTSVSDGGEPVDVGDVDVLGIWGADELEKFEAMVKPWDDLYTGNVAFTGTRDITAILTTRVEGGNPPDIAIPAEIGLFRQFASEGKLTPLSACPGLESQVRNEYPDSFIDLATVDGVLYGFFMKADTKGTIWYNPKVFAENNVEPLTADSSFDDLIALSQTLLDAGITPWSVGVESGAASGWPGSDWIQQILLNEAGGEVYDGIIDGSIPFTDEKMKDAWEKFGQIIHAEGFVLGGPTGANATGFQESAFPPFESPPQAAMLYLGGFASGFIADQFPNAVAGEDYDFFTFPGGGITGAANIAYAFNSDPGTCSLMLHLAKGESQKIWVELGGFTSVNKEVSLDSYPDAVTRNQADQLVAASDFRFDLDDAIGGAVQTAVFTAVTEYISDASSLDAILAGIEAARQ